MPAFLDLSRGDDQRTLELADRVLELGRHPASAVPLDSEAVSRHHARIEPDGQGYRLVDLNSRNGTLVNGERLTGSHRLHSGDVITICDFELRYRDSGEDASRLAVALVEDADAGAHISTLDVLGEPDRGCAIDPAAALAAVMAVTRELGSDLDLDALLPHVLATMFQVYPQADRGAILLVDAQGMLVPKAARTRLGDGGGEVRISRTVVERALTRKEAILSARVDVDPRFAGSESLLGAGARSLLCVPLLGRQGQALGVIELHTASGGGPFTADCLDLLRSVAGAAGIAIENARLHERLLLQQRMRHDLDNAREVQRSFLPSRLPAVRGYRFFGHWESAQTVGGDYYGFLPLPRGCVAIGIGDVAGKGLPAALLMARLSGEVRAALAESQDPAEALTLVNKALGESALDDRFVTFLLMVLDPARHVLRLANAGHGAPWLRRLDGTIEPLASPAGVPLNVSQDPRLAPRAVELELAPGAMVVAWTDGLSEAVDGAGEPFGEERIRKIVAASQDPEETGEALVQAVHAFAGLRRPKDDTTLLAFGRDGAGV